MLARLSQFAQFILAESGDDHFFVWIASRHVLKALLHALADGAENVGHGDAYRAGIATHAAPYASVRHVQHARHVKEQRVRWQPHATLALGPIPVTR